MTNGIILGILAWVSTLWLWHSLPHFVKMWSLKHCIITDFIVGITVYYSMGVFSKSIMCMVASVVAPLLMQCTLKIYEKPKMRAYLGLSLPEGYEPTVVDKAKAWWRFKLKKR